MMYNTSEFNMGSGFMENMINREMEVQILREAVTVIGRSHKSEDLPDVPCKEHCGTRWTLVASH